MAAGLTLLQQRMDGLRVATAARLLLCGRVTGSRVVARNVKLLLGTVWRVRKSTAYGRRCFNAVVTRSIVRSVTTVAEALRCATAGSIFATFSRTWATPPPGWRWNESTTTARIRPRIANGHRGRIKCV